MLEPPKLDHSANPGRHALKARRDDLYETPPDAVLALLATKSLPHHLWEPACGRGAIAKLLREAGHNVWATDLVNYGYGIGGIDFLMEHAAPPTCEAIVTNPPFKLADEFVGHALRLVPKVAMLLRLAFLESERRSEILDSGSLAKVFVFKRRLPMMHRDGWDGKIAGSSMAFAWFLWDSNHRGPALISRI